MIRKFLILFTLAHCLLFQEAKADIFGALSACVTDPCGCYCPTVNEQWRTQNAAPDNNFTTISHSYSSKCNCPPYNIFNKSLYPSQSTQNSSRPGCTRRNSPPSSWATYDFQCAESVKDNYDFDFASFFNPQIRVRIQSCFGYCWFSDKSLSFKGECEYFPSSNPVIPTRLCARVAYPAYPDGTPQDDGYTSGVHLTKDGYTERDRLVNFTQVTEVNGIDVTQVTQSPVVAPKICAYVDPDLFITYMRQGGGVVGMAISGIVSSIQNGSLTAPSVDFLDWNPTSQPLQKTTYGSPLVSLLIFAFQNALNLSGMLEGLLSKMFKGMDMSFMVDVIKYIGDVVNFVGKDVIVNLLQQMNSLNRIVDSSLGCVNIPLGPPPPPYCPTLGQNYRPIEMQAICRTNHDGTLEYPTFANQCQISSAANKYLAPAIRGTFNYLVPACANNAPLSDACITFSNILTPDAMHNLYGGRDFIAKCTSSITSGCVNTTFPASTTWSYNGATYSGYRLVYGYKPDSATSATIDSYIYQASDASSAYPACSSAVSGNCLFLYGINTGQYYDLSMQFPTTEPTYNTQDLTTSYTFTLAANNETVVATAKAIRAIDSTKTQTQGQICLYDDTGRMVDCQDRLTPPKPLIYSCGSPSANISCTSSHFAPKAVASVESAGLSSQGVVAAATIATQQSVITNLGGYDYDSFVTDANFRTIPFNQTTDAPNAYTANSRYGNYVNSVSPFNSNGSVNTNAIYIDGLEYDLGLYIVGGTEICLGGYQYDKCTNVKNKNCVLTTLVNNSPSLLLGDRVTPPPSSGMFLSDSQYFPFGDPSASFSTSTQSPRDKTAIEMNLCVGVPLPSPCPAVSTSDAPNNGNATWAQNEPSTSVTGTCLSGYVSGSPNGPQRACYLNKNTQTSSYQPVVAGTECASGFTIDPKLGWQKIPISMLQNEVFNLKIVGNISLCQAYMPSNNFQQSSANDSSGNPVLIPRVEDTSSYGVAMKIYATNSSWTNIVSLYAGDKISVMVGPNNICYSGHSCSASQTFYNVMTKSNESGNCAGSLQDYHPICGVVGFWNNKPYDSDWGTGGSSLVHQITGLSPQLGSMSIRAINSSDSNVYSNASGMSNYNLLYQNFSTGAGTYQIKLQDSNYGDNHGGYVVYVKQTKCVRSNGQYSADAGMTDRGRIQTYFATNGEDPNTTNPGASSITELTTASDGSVSYTAPGNGYVWMRVKNLTSDYANSSGTYNVSVTAVPFCSAITTADSTTGFATWPLTSVNTQSRGTCATPVAVLPYRSCGQSGSTGVFAGIVANTSCVDPSTFSPSTILYSPAADTDYINTSSGAQLSGSYLNVNLARAAQSSDNSSYSYNIYFSTTSAAYVATFSINTITSFGNVVITLNGTTVFNTASTNLTGWTNSTGSLGRSYYGNSASNAVLTSYLVTGINTMNVQVTNGGSYNSQYGPVGLIFNYVEGLGFDWSGWDFSGLGNLNFGGIGGGK